LKRNTDQRSAWCAALILRQGLSALLIALGAPVFAAAPNLEQVHAAVRVRQYERAVSLLQSLAATGDAGAEYELGGCYRSGQGVPKDYKQAVYWLDRAAKQGHTKAQYSLAVMFENGWGVDEDQAIARKWLQAAAAAGHPMAQAKLAEEDAAVPRQKPASSLLGREQGSEPASAEEALRMAARRGRLAQAQILAKRSKSIDAADRYGVTALMEAAAFGHEDVVAFLLDRGADA